MSTSAFQTVNGHRLQHFFQGGRDEWQCINCTERRSSPQDYSNMECAADA